MKSVYFDNAATTPLREEVIHAISEVMRTNFGNPSSSHSFGRSSKALVEKSRKAIAQSLNVSAGEIIFTSGGTEADNLVLNSAVKDLSVTHIITTKIEHHAVLHTIQKLQKEYSITISYVDIKPSGQIDYSHLERLLQKNAKALVSLMHINNEIGSVLDIKQVANMCKLNNALFHSDAVQSIGHYNMDLQEIKVDFVAAAAHKFHGPKGVGFAFIRKNSGLLKPLIVGGEQERGLRAGTESVHNIVGMEKALLMANDNLEKEAQYIKELKSYFIDTMKAAIPNVTFNGSSNDFDKSTYTLVNVCLPIDPKKAAMLLFQLDLKGIACSKGSACQSGSSQKSHVLSEILSNEDLEKPSIRFSFSIFNTKEEVDYVVNVLKAFAQ
ncbi:cysteine desulfurase [Algibacter amylolyticus]|uniref:cysteine desulfurase n=1 Tax=Algibacter amylolyticus TaxID=1608400 RepID=A0A5M7B891_9FLAO|nr:cysteine desulfurase family protein [Algibacter amylolyticus]KAA5823641.1 cysteine desulfurase [Algibacter amylolyticus]MBB5267803.1 cysteine desulfurase [Algibacter amylolyticus]TSJ74129.1 cysteine desulfurase [Algibacter amylolyticus]